MALTFGVTRLEGDSIVYPLKERVEFQISDKRFVHNKDANQIAIAISVLTDFEKWSDFIHNVVVDYTDEQTQRVHQVKIAFPIPRIPHARAS